VKILLDWRYKAGDTIFEEFEIPYVIFPKFANSEFPLLKRGMGALRVSQQIQKNFRKIERFKAL